MDYTPISTRRVLLAFALTVFVALLPVLYLLVHWGLDGPLPVDAKSGGTGRDMLLVGGSVVLTAALIGVFVLVMKLGRRLVRRPVRA